MLGRTLVLHAIPLRGDVSHPCIALCALPPEIMTSGAAYAHSRKYRTCTSTKGCDSCHSDLPCPHLCSSEPVIQAALKIV